MTRVCIDPGHGGSDPGACGNGLRECDVALNVALKVTEYLCAAGCEVIMTRETDVDVTYPMASAKEELQARCNVSDGFDAELFISIHCNAAVNEQAQGTETFYYAGSARGRKFAAYVQQQLINTLGTVNRGIKTNSLYVTVHTAAVAILVELAFLSNQEDSKLLANCSMQTEAARAIARGVTDYLTNR